MRQFVFALTILASACSQASDCQQANDLSQSARQADNKQALALYQQALSLCADNPQLHYLYGVSLMQNEQFAAAATAFKQALQYLNTHSGSSDYVNKRFSILLRQAENQLARPDQNRGETLQYLSTLHAYARQHQLVIPDAFAAIEQPFYQKLDQEPLNGGELKIAMRSVRDLAVEAPLAVEYRIPFDFNSDNPSPEGMKLLDKIADSLHELALKRVTVVGHTDSQGDAKYNLKLSERRAQSVKKLLLQQQPRLKGKLYAQGVGESQPRYSTQIPEQDSLNRRVEFILND